MTDPKKNSHVDDGFLSGIVKHSTTRLGWVMVIFIIFWTLALAASLYLNINARKKITREMAVSEAQAYFLKDQAFRKWAASHGGVYVPSDANTPPSPYLEHVKDRDLVSPSGKKLTLMNPTYIARQLNEMSSGLSGVLGHITSLKPLRPANSADPWEHDALVEFEKGKKEIIEFTKIKNRPYIRMMKAMEVREACMKCHEQQGYKVGDIRGGVSISIPLAKYLGKEKTEITRYILTHLVFWVLGLIGLGLGFQFIKKGITQRESAQEALRDSEQRHRKLIDEMLNGFALQEVVLDANGDLYDFRILEVNVAFEELIGLGRASVVGKTVLELLPNLDQAWIDRLGRVALGGEPIRFEQYFEELDKHLELLAYSPDRNNVAIIFTDITEKEKTRKDLEISLKEKEILLKEIHHRVKNNMQVISSLLNLQASAIKDEKFDNAINDSKQRIKTMAIIHESLYRSETLGTLDFAGYASLVAKSLLTTYTAYAKNVRMEIDVEEISLNMDQAVPIGLVINELITNALKYAFADDNQGEISIIAGRAEGNKVFLTVKDNGQGLPSDVDWKNPSSLGLQIVNALVKTQLHGELTLEPGQGTAFTVRFELA